MGIKDTSSEQTKIIEVPPFAGGTEQDPSIFVEGDSHNSQTKGGLDLQLLNRLETLGATALEILEKEMRSDDAERRRRAAVDLLGILNQAKLLISSNEEDTSLI